MQVFPTFPVPASLLERYPGFINHLKDLGAEIAVHGYYHVDLQTYPPRQASQQLLRAVDAFRQHGLDVFGFRCPYLSCSDELLDAIPDGIFEYSSNQAIKWSVPELLLYDSGQTNRMVATLDRFYRPEDAQSSLCLPRKRMRMVEIPVCVPDDLQLFDGFQMSQASVLRFWTNILEQIHRRGELITLMFHPELFTNCVEPLSEILRVARKYHPQVWVARLAEVSQWWLEKACFSVTTYEDGGIAHLEFNCTSRATILARDIVLPGVALEPWEGRYRRLSGKSLDLPLKLRPFLGLDKGVPVSIRLFLSDQGYLLDSSETARDCTVYLDEAVLSRQSSSLELVEWIESSPGPLVRFWRWPDGHKCAFNLSGDLDALSIRDYVSRLFID
jgi:peptidoglycan/xylan/chitin deacetylase (PgdA/CDA1 family)